MFISSYESAIDAKGRVSVPAPFRSALGGGNQIYLWPAIDGSPCLEGGGKQLMMTYKKALRMLSPQTDSRKAMAHMIFASSVVLKMDEPGRIKLPEALREKIGLEKHVLFVGNLDSFQVWAPEAYAEYDARMTEIARKQETLTAFENSYAQVINEIDDDFADEGDF